MFARCQENKAKLHRDPASKMCTISQGRGREIFSRQARSRRTVGEMEPYCHGRRQGTVWCVAGLSVSGEQSWGAGVSCRGRKVRKGSEAVEQVLRFVL